MSVIRGRAACATLALLLCACATTAPSPSERRPAPVVKRIRIIHTSDLHGRLLPQSPPWATGRIVGGAGVMAAHFDSAAAQFAGPTLLLSAGDDMQGTAISNLSWGRATIAAMNASGYDAAALGNHEFDWGQDTLAARIAESRFPWLAANLYLSSTRRQPEWARPWVLLKRGGVRTAVIGITLPETPAGLPADRLAGLEFGPAIPAIREAAAQARAAGADFVVVLLHVGATCRVPGRVAEEASMDCTGPLLQVADSVHAFVDLVMGGHTHQRVLTTEGGIPVVEAASYGTAYSVTDLEKHGDSVHVRYQGVRTPFADEVRPDSAVEVAIAAWRTRVAPLTERVVATLASNMQDATGGMSAEFPLGILVAEAQRAMAETDVGLVNSSAIRRSLPAGPVTYGMLFELQPFQNQLVRVELSGRELRAVLERALTSEGTPDAQLAGMTVTYVAAAPQGRRIVGIRLADGRPLGDTDRVTLASTDFMVTSPRYPELQRARVIPTAMKDVDALERYLAKLPSPIQPPPTGRWRTVP